MAEVVPPAVKLFQETVPLQMQMLNLTTLREQDPTRAKEIFMLGQELIEYSARGELRALKKKVLDIRDDLGIFPYFGSKMFKESLINGHLLVNKAYPSPMHEVLEAEAVQDYLGVGVVNFLAAQGCDINRQISGSWLTPLHIAVRRNMVQTVAALIALGADVNAVGKNDVMPLKIALEQVMDIKQSENAALITKMLQESGAKQSLKALLRGDSEVPASVSAGEGGQVSGFSFSTAAAIPFTTSSMVSVSSGDRGNRVKGGTVVMDEPAQAEAKSTTKAPSAEKPAMASATGGAESGGFVRFTGAAGGMAPVVVSSASTDGPPKTIFTKFSSSTQQMNDMAQTQHTATQAIRMISTGAGGETAESSDIPPAKAYSMTSDDGGMMFSTS